MKERNNRSRKRLHIIPLILGLYGAFLGFGLVAIGLAGIGEGVGIVRLLIGLGMACFGLYGIWDGVRDLAGPKKKPENLPARQLILTDMSGNKSSNVTMERLEEQLNGLMEKGNGGGFHIQILPPPDVGEQGRLKQISCIFQGEMILIAFFEKEGEGYGICQRKAGMDMTKGWLSQFLSGSLDFSGWENVETKIHVREEGEVDAYTEEEAEDWHQFLTAKEGVLAYWRQLLVIFGESWHDEHKFFSAKDVELAVEGVHEGKYQKAVLEWGAQAFHVFPGQQDELMVIWSRNNPLKKEKSFLAREGTATQVKFWLNSYLNNGFIEEMGGWSDITAQVEKEWRKYGKVL